MWATSIRQQHAGPLAAARQAVAQLHVRRTGRRPLPRAVARTLDEVEAGHRGHPHQLVHLEDERTIDEPVDREPVTVRVDRRHARVVALEVEAGRRDDAIEIGKRRVRGRRRGVASTAPAPGVLERRRLAVLGWGLAEVPDLPGRLRASSGMERTRRGGAGESEEGAAAWSSLAHATLLFVECG
jgi:hypothetical protein